MAVSALNKICGTVMEITEHKHEELIRQSEQFRILKNYIKLESTFTKSEVINLINAMDMEEKKDE